LSDDTSKVGGPVVHPEHYNACGEKGDDGSVKYEPIKIIEAWGLEWGFCMGNALKYILRAPYKGSERADLEKALWYLRRIIDGARSWERPGGDDECKSLDVSNAWSLPPDLAEAVKYIEADNPQGAEHHVMVYLSKVWVTEQIPEENDKVKVIAYKLEVLVLDFDDVGAEAVKNMVENTRYLSTEVKGMETRVVEWTDDHPLNKQDTADEAYRKLFEEK